MLITLIAYDPSKDDKLVAVVRLKYNNEEDEEGKPIFPEGTYRLSGLYVDKPYPHKGIGQVLVKSVFTTAVEHYHADLIGFFSHSKETQEVYKRFGCTPYDTRKIHHKEAAIYLITNPSSMLATFDNFNLKETGEANTFS